MRKNIDKKKIVYLGIFLFFAIIFTIVYFYFLPVVTSDGTGYHRSAQVISGNLPLSEWQAIRGPILPLILYISGFLFGDTPLGFQIISYLFFVVSILFMYLIMKEFLKESRDSFKNNIICFFSIVLIIFNPLIIGYFHVMLTEFVAITISFVACFVFIKWMSYKFEKDNYFKLFICSFFIIVLVPISWFLKQPYIIVVLGPFILATILSILKDFSFKNTILRISVLILSVFVLLTSIILWNRFLTIHIEAEESSSSLEQNFFAEGVIRANSNFRYIEKENLSEEELNGLLQRVKINDTTKLSKIINKESNLDNYDFYEVLDKYTGEGTDIMIVEYTTDNPEPFVRISKFFKTAILNYPSLVIHSYYLNYLSLINVNKYDYGQFFSLKERLSLEELHGENENIGLSIYFRKSTFLGSASGRAINMDQYKLANTSKVPIKIYNDWIRKPSLLLFKYTFILLPFLLIFSLIKYAILKCEKNSQNTDIQQTEILIIILGFSFLHVLSHVFSGAIVDRYTIVAYPLALLGIILFISSINIKKLGILKFLKKNNKK